MYCQTSLQLLIKAPIYRLHPLAPTQAISHHTWFCLFVFVVFVFLQRKKCGRSELQAGWFGTSSTQPYGCNMCRKLYDLVLLKYAVFFAKDFSGLQDAFLKIWIFQYLIFLLNVYNNKTKSQEKLNLFCEYFCTLNTCCFATLQHNTIDTSFKN